MKENLAVIGGDWRTRWTPVGPNGMDLQQAPEQSHSREGKQKAASFMSMCEHVHRKGQGRNSGHGSDKIFDLICCNSRGKLFWKIESEFEGVG